MSKLINKIIRKYIENQIIHTALIELTFHCPCDCIHCYLNRESQNELTTKEVLDLLKQLKNEGTMNLAFTGGEPFLRKDLAEILKKAREYHFYTSLLSSGILIQEAEVKLLKETQVGAIDISLHGADAETHDKIMNFPGAFVKTIKAIKLLTEAQIEVTVKCVIMKQNYKQLDAIRKLVSSLGGDFTPQILIVPKIDGCKTPLDHSLDQTEILELGSGPVSGGISPGEDFEGGRVIKCTAGTVVAAISPHGDVYPCLLLRHKMGNIRETPLSAIWHNNNDSFIHKLRHQNPENVHPCFECSLKDVCQRCPGSAYIETNDINGKPLSCCHLAESLHKRQHR